MDTILTPIQIRVIGCLLEKEMTTPEYYPLSLNALTNACNQKSNRDPVMELEEPDVLRALDQLKAKKLATTVSMASSRVLRYKHNMVSTYHFKSPEIAVLTLLFLRGPQTVGELRSRSGRLYEFESLAEVENTLQKLAAREDGPFVTQLPREPGRRENRYAHLFGGKVKIEKSAATAPEVVTPAAPVENERISKLEQEVSVLRKELEQLKTAFGEFKGQFE
jgi:uncharacterized protein YceH (UPF0502 family)